jgi:hypothetical protein
LLRLEGNDSLDLFLVDRRQFHEARENRLFRHRVVHVSALDLQLAQHLAQRSDNLRAPHFLFGRIDKKLSRTVAAQDQSPVRVYTKLRQLDVLRTEIESGDRRPGGHAAASIPQFGD